MNLSLQSDLPQEQEGDDFDVWVKVANWVSSVGDENGCETTVWCDYAVRDFAKVAYEGDYTVHYDGGWGIAGSESVMNPTYLQLWQIADRLIRQSGDLHHVFVEYFFIKGDGILELSTGS